jgi:uncharacterized membrane protein YedE/YeeE
MSGIATAATPLQSLAGGALIGLSAVMLMALLGRIMGATGILSGFVMPDTAAEWGWRAALLLGMVSAPGLILATTGRAVDIDVSAGPAALVAGGLLVGVGAATARGCTSGHGVCGMARLSRRSFAATATFMATTFVTVFVVRHVAGA